ncbi:hypothetical protein [Shewanella sp. AC91-MNA-CIBAN-0169]|uniref:hypothetical protein n=1 Tax=Shewanella sp. AC91-MNA-CIBAN-0169 TaxID=3140466 RepID=UPI00331F5E96
MPIFDRNNPADLKAIAEAQQFTVECFERYQLCKKQLDTLNKQAVRQWLERLPIEQREKCRVTLNNIMVMRRRK